MKRLFFVFKILFFPLKTLALLGVQPPISSFQSRITLVTNIMAVWGTISLLSLAFALDKYGLDPKYYTVIYGAMCLVALLMLIFNWKKKYLWARVAGAFVLIACGWQAAIIYGKSFNGYYIFFGAMIYVIVALHRDAKFLKWTLLLVIGSVVLNDILFHKNIIPITGLHSSDFSVAILLMDTFLVTSFMASLLLIEKSHSIKYESSLEQLNSDLEGVVSRRTAMLLKAKEEVFHAGIIKAQFVSNTSHELRIPIQGIKGYLHIGNKQLVKLNNTPLNESQKSLVKSISKSLRSTESSSDRLYKLVERLLQLTKNEEDQLKAYPNEIKLRSLVKEVVTNYESLASEKNMKIDFSDKEDFVCYVDSALLQKVMENLLDNAIKYGKENSVIEVRLIDKVTFIDLSVKNEGVGVLESEREKIFEPFVQGSRTDKLVGGSGIGLSLSRKYAAAMKARIYLTDTSEESTTFIIEIPNDKSI